jgi:Ca2+-binding EF-hand superfamily protein
MNLEEAYGRDFDAIDADANGVLSRKEYVEAFKARHAEPGDPDWFPNYQAHQERLLTQLLREFDAFDADGDGGVTREEYIALRREQAAAADDMRWFLALDKDASGYLSADDLDGPLDDSPAGQLRRRLAMALKHYDRDGDGKLWLDEFLAGQREGRARARAARA